MRFECKSCNKIYKVADELLPTGKKIAFPCKNCKSIIKLDLRENAEKKEPQPFEIPKYKNLEHEEPQKIDEQKLSSIKALKKKILFTMGSLPPMPQVVIKAQKILADPLSGIAALAKIIETDQAMATRTLSLANSAYYGLSGKVTSIQHASVLLGETTLSEVINMAGASGILSKKMKGYGYDSGDLWKHSLAVAFGSKKIAEKVNPDISDDSFLAGLLHDSGKIALDRFIYERKDFFVEFLEQNDDFKKAEKAILGFDHAEIGEEICKKWGIPESLLKPVKFHHDPFSSAESELSFIVYIANIVAKICGFSAGSDSTSHHIDEKALDFFCIQFEDVNVLIPDIQSSVEKILETM